MTKPRIDAIVAISGCHHATVIGGYWRNGDHDAGCRGHRFAGPVRSARQCAGCAFPASIPNAALTPGSPTTDRDALARVEPVGRRERWRVLNRRPTGDSAILHEDPFLVTTITVNRRRPLCRHGDRAIHLPASRNCTAHTSSSRIRPLAAMSNSDRAGSLVATNSTNQKTGSSPLSSAVYTTRRLRARLSCGESRGDPGRALRC